MEIRNYILSFIIGALSEVLVFSRGEWERHSPKVVLAFVLLFLGNISLLAFGFGFTLLTSLLETYALGLALVSGIFSCMVAYRLFFHPLKSFPGPLAARISAFWIFRQNVPDLKFYVKLRKVHEQYGDFVRIRPREISICHPDAVVDVHGPRNKIRKGEFYEHIYPFQSLQLSRDAAYHKNQRRHWDKAFQTKALQEYSPCLSKHYKILMNKISREAANETPIDISNNLMDLFFDIVSELTFGKSFDALTTGKRNPIIGEFLKEKKPVGFILITLWIFHLMRQLPIVKKNIKYWMDWYSDALAKRKDMDLKGTDFYTYLSKSEDFDFNGVQEAQLAIIAGADTVAITLSNACYFLCQYPEYQAKLYEEIRDLPTNPNGLIDDQLLVGKEYLLGIINESLRLHPPAPSGLQRLTPPEGATIAGRYIPGDTIVTTPTYSVHRDTRAFVKPDQFIPERWSSQPELVPRKDAFIPFSYGAYSCAGKPLAMIQMRMVLAMLVRKYELRFAPGKEAECRQYIEDQADCFTLNTHELPLVFKERVGKK